MEERRDPGMVVFSGGGYDLDLAKRSVGAGWHSLLERVWAAKPDSTKIVQVKEKFGGLRVYTSSGPVRADILAPDGFVSFRVASGEPDEFEKLIAEVEAESLRMCEDCGAPGVLRPHRWMRTLCDACDILAHATSGSTTEGEGGPGCRFRERP